MNEVKHTCCAPIYSSGSYRSYRCDKGAKYEHEGDWYCKTHHPPTVKAKRDASYSKWVAERQAQRAEERAAEDAAAEQKRRADAYDRLIAEAGTVFHNTGLSPVQLVEMVKEMEVALRGLVSALSPEIQGSPNSPLEIARAALAKCEGVGND